MRKFTRGAHPPGWLENQQRWNEQWVELLRKNPKATFSWYTHEKISSHKIAMPSLKTQTNEHCSFCDAFPVEGVSAETIEHFRPKCAGAFPERAYTWENLYYCCSQCQSHKRERWAEDLLAPDGADFSCERYFEFDFTTGEMRPKTDASGDDRKRAMVTLEIYGLDSSSRRRNRKLELRKWSRTHPPEFRNSDEFAYRYYVLQGTDGAGVSMDVV